MYSLFWFEGVCLVHTSRNPGSERGKSGFELRSRSPLPWAAVERAGANSDMRHTQGDLLKKVLFFRTFSRSFSVPALGFTHSNIVQKSSFFGNGKTGDRVSEAFLGRFWAKNGSFRAKNGSFPPEIYEKFGHSCKKHVDWTRTGIRSN